MEAIIKNPKKVLSIRLHSKMIEKLKQYKIETGVSVNAFIEVAIAREMVIKGIIGLPKRDKEVIE